MLMDEPFAALDARPKAACRKSCLRLRGPDQDQLRFITHDIEEAVLPRHVVAVSTAVPARIDESDLQRTPSRAIRS